MTAKDEFEEKWLEKFSQAAKSEADNRDQTLFIEGNPYYRAYFFEYTRDVLGKGNSNTLVLDVGCGTGSTCRVLAERGFEVYGVDFSPEIVEVAKEKAARSKVPLHVQVADIYSLPFEDHMFDIVICNYLFQTVSDYRKVLLEALRVLKPRGRIFIITLNSLSIGKILLRDDIKLYDPRHMKETMEQLGFENIDIKGIYLFTRTFDWLVGWILRLKIYRAFNLFFPLFIFFAHSFYMKAQKK